ncbi:LysM peptidoglycan-binding domain-containing protein [Sporosarcina sp. JAI121]|uniref:LysM peptidoglycan-binding domain-containing protein n=1 Tax=Sporosarcina sp. JAI121 TaxID=2723064 RepID=UPI0015C6D931|nr:LysM peptidoglycan-binding domain-containing protein [Sporosarcina sp. JAI121]NYF24481.1 LysM repeat protein [Sporosarcina sp. JAI121]
MKKDDYKTEFEEHRKEISLDEDHGVDNLPSRAELHRKGRKPKKKSGHMMINVILGLFTLIPVLILVYFISDFYNPSDRTSAKGGESGIRFETSDKTADKKTEATDKEIALNDKADDNSTDSKEEENSAEKSEVESKEVQKPVVNVNPAPVEKPEVKPVVKPETKPEKKVEPEKKPDPKPASKSHTVASNENLYRISLKYYGNGSGVEKIKSANGLSSNEIRVGQTLVIP